MSNANITFAKRSDKTILIHNLSRVIFSSTLKFIKGLPIKNLFFGNIIDGETYLLTKVFFIVLYYYNNILSYGKNKNSYPPLFSS